jgi:N-succinyldiaminopimelate aminotransferase
VQRRYGVTLDAATQVLPVNGSREALFSLAQTVLDPAERDAVVVCPNPFYQIYEGAALLGGANTAFANSDPARNFACDWSQIDEATWAARAGLRLLARQPHRRGDAAGRMAALFELSDRHGFVIASDECYSEIYFRRSPAGRPAGRQGPGPRRFPQPGDVLQPVQALQRAGHALGLRGRRRRILKAFLLYRTYHGSAMSPTVQMASIAAWNDEAHVQDNRPVPREVRASRPAGRGAGREAARRRLLPVGRRARGRRHRLRLGCSLNTM